ncbi:MAG: GFA family protein [Pseudomonadota bacterium]
MGYKGGCLCGAVRYTVNADPLVTRMCWCRDCQKFGAGSATVNAIFPSEAVHIEGVMGDYESIAASGNVMHRGFCPKCGTPITTASEALPHVLGIRVGTLDNQGLFSPDIVIWTRSAPDWACIDPDLEAYEGQPPAPARAKDEQA